MSSTIVLGADLGTKEKAIENILDNLGLTMDENNPDVLSINPEEGKKSIGIAQTKQINRYINEKPYSHKHKAVIIKNAEILTTQAQNALLKDLEEHPSYVEIVLGAKTEKDVLETVLSRCKRINLKNNTKESSDEMSFQKFIQMSEGDRLNLVATLAKEDKSEILDKLDTWITQARKDIRTVGAGNVEILLKIKKDLESTNINTKLALEFLSLALN